MVSASAMPVHANCQMCGAAVTLSTRLGYYIHDADGSDAGHYCKKDFIVPDMHVVIEEEIHLTSDEIGKLIEERQKTHGDAWNITNALLRVFDQQDTHALRRLADSGVLINWIQCLNKLVRASQSPSVAEHWLDVEGWARLIREKLEQSKGGRVV